MSTHVSSWVWKLRDVTHTQKIILLFLADKANDDGWCWPGRTSIAEACCLTQRTVITATQELQRIGYLSFGDRRDGRYGTNVYRIHLRGEGSSPLRGEGASPLNGSRGENDCNQGVKQLHPKHQKATISKNPPTPQTEAAPQSVLPFVAPEAARPVSLKSQTRQAFEHWRKQRGKNGNAKLTPGRGRTITSALKAGYPLADILDAIDGVSADPWDGWASHDDLTVILRLGGGGKRNNLEYFRDLHRNRPATPAGGFVYSEPELTADLPADLPDLPGETA